MSAITVNGTPLISNILYAPFGPTRGWQWGNGTYTVREYDTDGRVTAIDSAGLSTYTYYPDGTIQSRTDSSPTPDSMSLPSLAINVSATSNRIDSVVGNTSRNYAYDAAGNTISDGQYSFMYDDAGRLISVSAGSETTTYVYNGLGQRVRKIAPGGTSHFVYDEAGHLLGVYAPNGDLIEEIVWFGDIPVASLRTSQSGGIGFFYIHTDHLNAPTRLTRSEDNAIVWRWDHDPYGMGSPDEDPDGNAAVVFFNLRFPGQYYDAETGLNYNYFRDYDPYTGRYLESDPIGLGGGLNTYAYVGGNPISYTDFLGLVRRCIELYGFREFESRNWSTVKTRSGDEFVLPGPGGGQLGLGADPQFPSPGNPRGGVVPSVDMTVVLWWVRMVFTQGQEGYELRSFIRGLMECREDDPCKDPHVTTHEFRRDYTPWKRVVTRDVNEKRLEYMRRYGETKLPIPLPGMR